MSKDLSNYGDSPLVTADWLSEHLDGPFLRVVVTRKGDGYAASHIPTALSLGRTHELIETNARTEHTVLFQHLDRRVDH